jgi:peptidase inhibitor family I36
MRVRFVAFAMILMFLTTLPASAQWRWGRPHPPKGGACFYRDPGFGGDYFCLRAGEQWPNMPAGFNDRISSIRVFGDARVRLFNDFNFRGPSLLADRDLPDLRAVPMDPRRNWSDRISSIAVFRGRDRWGGPPPPEPPPYRDRPY